MESDEKMENKQQLKSEIARTTFTLHELRNKYAENFAKFKIGDKVVAKCKDSLVFGTISEREACFDNFYINFSLKYKIKSPMDKYLFNTFEESDMKLITEDEQYSELLQMHTQWEGEREAVLNSKRALSIKISHLLGA